jgi:hypothetical protein
MKYVLTGEGKIAFPLMAKKVFQIRVSVLNPRYCQARAVGRKTWSLWATDWFRKVRKTKGE